MDIVGRSDDLRKIIDLVSMNLILGRLTDSNFNKNNIESKGELKL